MSRWVNGHLRQGMSMLDTSPDDTWPCGVTPGLLLVGDDQDG
jgi:hypothetical protein